MKNTSQHINPLETKDMRWKTKARRRCFLQPELLRQRFVKGMKLSLELNNALQLEML